MKGVLLAATLCSLQPQTGREIGIQRGGHLLFRRWFLFVDELSLVIDAVELQNFRCVLPIDSLLNARVALRVEDHAVLVENRSSFFLFSHDRVHSEQCEVRLREVLGIANSRLLSAERTADD